MTKAFMRTWAWALSLLLTPALWATHNQAGEILICHVPGNNPLLYEVTIITWTDPSSPADRDAMTMNWGDGTITTVPRERYVDTPIAGISARRNIYTARHVYPGPGTYELEYIDPNRVANVINIPESVNIPMSVRSTLTISPVGGNSCSPRFLNAPIQNACFGELWIHNPGAYDPDGDSLSYHAEVCLGGDVNDDGRSEPVFGYRFPNEIAPSPANNYSIDPVTGTITWDAPQSMGMYNIAFSVHEWRRTANGRWQRIGKVMRDMQVIVTACNNRPPVIREIRDTCVEAGSNLTLQVQATDPDPGQTVRLNAFGGPFEVTPGPAVFNTAPGMGTAFGTFSWTPTCGQVQQQPYQLNISARDDYPLVQLYDFETVFITVVGPAPRDPVVVPDAGSLVLSWSPSVCSNVVSYRIYRRTGRYGFIPDHCELDVPAYTGYSYIGSTTGHGNTTYRDTDVLFGSEQCYMVVAVFPDGARSYASVEVCGMLRRELPVITKVSVIDTDPNAGSDSLQWATATSLDTLQYPGPYSYRILRGSGYTNATTVVHTSATHPYLRHPDTTWVDNSLNTSGQAHVYRVEMLHGPDATPIGTTNPASSVYLQATPTDERVTLSINHAVPWNNSTYIVYRMDGGSWTEIGSTTTTSFADSMLVNGGTYCYRVKSRGAYSDPSIGSPLLNYSQEVCATPVDNTPPCIPQLRLENDCELPLNTLRWNNIAEQYCGRDTERFRIWFTDSLGGERVPIASVLDRNDTIFTHSNGTSVAGCYSITAIDSVGNESAHSNVVCGDNCPDYRLPNIFTPNGDRVNDTFKPFPYRGVTRIDLEVYNRWGQVVFRTNDPAIGWNGQLMDTTEPVPDGVYFYVCVVHVQRLEGVVPEILKGHVQILRDDRGPQY